MPSDEQENSRLPGELSEFDWEKLRDQSERGESERAEFISRFPIDSIPAMTLDTYAVGKGSRDTFCYWLEYGTKTWGGVGGGGANKHIISWDKSDGLWRFPDAYRASVGATAA